MRQHLWENFRKSVLARKFVQDVGVLTVGNLAAMTLNVLQGILVARWLGPEAYGTAALVLSYPALAHTLFDARSRIAGVKYLSEFQVQGQRKRLLAMCKLGYGIDLIIASLTFLAVLATAKWVAQQVAHDPDSMGLMIAYAAAYIPQAVLGTSSAILASHGKFATIARLNIAVAMVRVTLVLALVYSGWNVAGVVWGNVIAMTVTGLLFGKAAFSLMQDTWGASPLQGDWQALKGRRQEILRFIAFTNLNVLVGGLVNRLDVLLLGFLRGPTEAGYYRLATSIASSVKTVQGPFRSAVYPRISRLWEEGRHQELKRSIRRYSLWVGMPLGGMILASLPLIPMLISFVTDVTYLPAAIAVQLLLAKSAIGLTCFWLQPLLFALGEVKFLAQKNALVASLTLVGFLVAIPNWGHAGVALVLLLAGALGGSLANLIYLLNRQRALFRRPA